MRKELEPSLRAAWLGQELKKMRKAAKLDAKEVGSYLGIHASIISRIENGRTAPTEGEVEDYLRVCGISDSKRRKDMLTVCHDVRRKGWWDGYSDDVARTLMDCMWLESKALRISTFAPIVLPGLLQTPAYAKAVMRAIDADAPPSDLKRWLEVRMNRQVVITRQEPVEFAAIIDEAAIRRAPIDQSVLADQLEYLTQVSQRAQVEIRVLPFEAGLHASLGGAFEIHCLEVPYPQVALLPTAAGDLCVEGEDVDHVIRAYDSLQDDCLSPKDSQKFIVAERHRLD